MKVKLLKSIVVQDAPGARVGDVIETKHGHGLCVEGLAVEYKAEPIEIETRVEVIENRDPVPSKKKSK